MISAGTKVRFKAHGETGLPYTVVTRDGDECQLHDSRNRVLVNVPVELLEKVENLDALCSDPNYVQPMPEQPPKCWREVDELEIF